MFKVLNDWKLTVSLAGPSHPEMELSTDRLNTVKVQPKAAQETAAREAWFTWKFPQLVWLKMLTALSQSAMANSIPHSTNHCNILPVAVNETCRDVKPFSTVQLRVFSCSSHNESINPTMARTARESSLSPDCTGQNRYEPTVCVLADTHRFQHGERSERKAKLAEKEENFQGKRGDWWGKCWWRWEKNTLQIPFVQTMFFLRYAYMKEYRIRSKECG